jgi:hypothetical protein
MNKFWIVMLSSFLLNGCGSSSSSGGTSTADIANYLPRTSMLKQYSTISKVNGDFDSREYSNNILVESNLVYIKKDNSLEGIVTVLVDEVNFKSINDRNETRSFKREVAIGEEVSNSITKSDTEILTVGMQKIGEQSTRMEENCVLEAILDEYQISFYTYKNYDSKHDILKIKCVTKTFIETEIDSEYIDLVAYTDGIVESKDDVSYLYLQEGIGEIARINDDCLVSKLPDVIDDMLDKSQCLGERYNYNLYHPQY